MNRLLVTPPSRWRAAVRPAAGLLIGFALSGCIAKSPKGEVVAVVNGDEITTTDLQSEQRALGARSSDPRVLTSRVVDRVLLAQAAHHEKLDSYPGFPADLMRLRQGFLAQRVIQADVKPPPAPTDVQLNAFIQAHPTLFAQRMRVALDEVRFRNVDDLKSLEGTVTLAEIEGRLRTLNVTTERSAPTIDTGQLPPDMARRLIEAPIGNVIYIKGNGETLAAAVRERAPINLSPAQMQAVAKQLMGQIANQRAIEGKLKALQVKSKITYQAGYSPPNSSPAAGANVGPSAPPTPENASTEINVQS